MSEVQHKPLLVVSFATAGTPYESEAEDLRQSLVEHGLEHAIHRVPDLGSWEANTGRKATFLRDMLRLHGRYWRLCWIDCDAVVRGPLDFLDLMDAGVDVAAHVRKGRELMSGTVYLNDSPATRAVVERWIGLVEKKPRRMEQANLWDAIKATPAVNFAELPASYCFVFDSFRRQYPGVEPVIEHFQASRKYRRKTAKGEGNKDFNAKAAKEEGKEEGPSSLRSLRCPVKVPCPGGPG